MAHLRRYWSVAAFFLVLAAAIAMRKSRPTSVEAAPGPTNVIVTNTPLPVSVANDSSLQPFQASTSCTIAVSGTTCTTVPADNVLSGQRLVIEFISATASLASGDTLVSFGISTTAGGTPTTHFLAPGYVSGTLYALSQKVQLYADPSSSVAFQCTVTPGSASGLSTCNFTISGFVVNTP